MKHLIPMTDYVLLRVNTPLGGQQVASVRHHELEKYRQIFKYANFLKQPLKIEMFVPCDEDGNIIDENYFCSSKCCDCDCEFNLKKAKEKVIFEGFVATITNNEIQIKSDNHTLYFDVERNQFYYKEILYWQPVKLIEDLIPYNLEIKNEILLF
jgi:hypothetical protein